MLEMGQGGSQQNDHVILDILARQNVYFLHPDA